VVFWGRFSFLPPTVRVCVNAAPAPCKPDPLAGMGYVIDEVLTGAEPPLVGWRRIVRRSNRSNYGDIWPPRQPLISSTPSRAKQAGIRSFMGLRSIEALRPQPRRRATGVFFQGASMIEVTEDSLAAPPAKTQFPGPEDLLCRACLIDQITLSITSLFTYRLREFSYYFWPFRKTWASGSRSTIRGHPAIHRCLALGPNHRRRIQAFRPSSLPDNYRHPYTCAAQGKTLRAIESLGEALQSPVGPRRQIEPFPRARRNSPTFAGPPPETPLCARDFLTFSRASPMLRFA